LVGDPEMLDPAAFHGGDDVVGERNLSVVRYWLMRRRWRRRISRPGFEQIQRVLEIREGVFQIGQFCGAGIMQFSFVFRTS
jgi:hypothetical protein